MKTEEKKRTAASSSLLEKIRVFSHYSSFDATREMERMGQLAITNLEQAMNCLITLEEKKSRKCTRQKKSIDYLNHEITNYLVKINQTRLPADDARSIGSLFHVVNDIERIGDHAENIADAAKSRIERQVNFSDQAKRELSEMLDRVIKITTYALDMFSTNNQEHMQEILELEDSVTRWSVRSRNPMCSV